MRLPALLALAVTARLASAQDASIAKPPDAREIVLTSPFQAPRASFFHAALEVPPLEPARTLEPFDFLLRIETSHVRSVERRSDGGIESHFDGLFHEWFALKAAAGVLPGLEKLAW